MTLKVYPQMEQRSEQWYEARRGIVTASMVGSLITSGSPDTVSVACPKCGAEPQTPCVSLAKGSAGTPIKSLHIDRGEAASSLPDVLKVADNDTSRRVIATLVAERIAGWSDPTYVNDDMARGIWHEPYARDAYAEHHGVTVDEVGFMVRDDWGFKIGASPDGLVGDDGGLEVKCPRAKSHISTILADEVPAHYMPQVQACLLVSGRAWWDYVSFCGGLPLWTKRVYPDPSWFAVIADAVRQFELIASDRVADFAEAAAPLPVTERVPDDLVVA